MDQVWKECFPLMTFYIVLRTGTNRLHIYCIFFQGKRFRFTYHDKKNRHIYESIEALDRMVRETLQLHFDL